MRRAAALGAGLALVPGVARACSDGAAAVARAEWLGWAGAGLSAALLLGATVLAKRRGIGRGPLAAGWVMVAAHPGLWVSARSGDCGTTRTTGALLFTGVALAVLLWAAWRPAPPSEDAPTGS